MSYDELRFASVAVLLRTYNNNTKTYQAVLHALRAGVGLVLVVVNAHDRSTRGNVRYRLSKLSKSRRARVHIIELEEGYTWTSALNLGISQIRDYDDVSTGIPKSKFRYVLTSSVEARWSADDLQLLFDVVTRENVHMAAPSFMGMSEGQEVPLGVSYKHPRNTLCLYDITVFVEVMGFNPACDAFGGMEDFYFCIEAHLKGFRFRANVGIVRLLVDVHKPQPAKEATERNAMRKIVKLFRSRYTDASPGQRALLFEVLDRFDALDLGPAEVVE